MENRSILIVDDDEEISRSLKEILESEGYKVDVALTGREAITKFRVRYYNLALLDIKLPDIEGTELLPKMHRDTPQTMRIIMTGFPSLDNAVKALNFGADAYVMKPIEPEKLLKVVAQKIKEQEEAEKMGQDKVAEWVQARLKRCEEKHEEERALTKGK